jgi:hypothetical protein
MSSALPIEIMTATIRWSESRDPAADGLLPPFGATLLQAYQSQLEPAGPRALLAVAVRELIPDSDDPANADAEVERSTREFIERLDDAFGPSDHGLALAARYLAYTRGAITATPRDVMDAISLIASREFAYLLEVWRPVCQQSIELLRQDYHRTHAPRQSCEAEVLAAIGPYIRQYAVGSVIPALSRYLDHARQVVGPIASLSAGALARALLTEQTTFLVVDRDLRADAREQSIDEALDGCVFGNVDHLLEFLFVKTIADVRLASDYAVAVRRRDEVAEPSLFARAIMRPLRPSLPARLADARVVMHRLLDEQPAIADLLAAKAAFVGSSVSPAPLLMIGGDRMERRELFRALAVAVGIRVVTVNIAGLAEIVDRSTQLTSMIATAGHSTMIDPLATDGVILVLEGLEAFHVDAMPDLSAVEWHREHRLAAQRALATFLQTAVAEAGLFSVPWISGPLWIVCCQAEPAPGWSHAGSGLDGAGLIPELQDCLQETVRLGPPSVRAMVSMLRQIFEEVASEREDTDEVANECSVIVPEATIWTAAHIAKKHKASIRFARVVIEAAIQRALLRREGRSDANAIIIAPDDLKPGAARINTGDQRGQ